MLVKDFIAGLLKREIKAMAIQNNNQTHAYLGFSLILQGIEFLGGCLDDYNWSERSLSEKRFRLAIKKLFPKKYIEYNNKKIFLIYILIYDVQWFILLDRVIILGLQN